MRALLIQHNDMVKDEKEFARLPGARIINRYMPGTSLEARERALQNLKKLLATLIEVEERKHSDVAPHVQARSGFDALSSLFPQAPPPFREAERS